MTTDSVMPPSVAVPAVAVKLDVHGRLDEDVACRKCGYNLRGLSPDGRCPECGVAVGRSLQGDYLRFAEPQWVRTLASGMRWIVAAIAIGIIVGGIAGGLTAGLGLNQLWLESVQLGVSLIGFIGYWKVTTPDPAGFEDESHMTPRKMVRVTQVTGLLIGAASMSVQESWEVLTLIVSLSAVVVSVVGTITIFIYARKLALRIPDHKMAKHCRIVMWALVVLMGASFMLAVAIGISGGGQFAMGGCVLAVGYLFFALWALRLIERFRKAFKEAAKLAAATWAAAPQAGTIGDQT